MKKLIIALAAAGGLCVAAGTAATAAPVSTPAAGLPVTTNGLFTPVQYYGGYGGGGYGYRYKPRCYYVKRCYWEYGYQRCRNERVCE